MCRVLTESIKISHPCRGLKFSMGGIFWERPPPPHNTPQFPQQVTPFFNKEYNFGHRFLAFGFYIEWIPLRTLISCLSNLNFCSFEPMVVSVLYIYLYWKSYAKSAFPNIKQIQTSSFYKCFLSEFFFFSYSLFNSGESVIFF